MQDQGTITLIFQEVGKSTMQMGSFEVGDAFENVVAGPLLPIFRILALW